MGGSSGGGSRDDEGAAELSLVAVLDPLSRMAQRMSQVGGFSQHAGAQVHPERGGGGCTKTRGRSGCRAAGGPPPPPTCTRAVHPTPQVLLWLRSVLPPGTLSLSLTLNPQTELSELPLKSFYR